MMRQFFHAYCMAAIVAVFLFLAFTSTTAQAQAQTQAGPVNPLATPEDEDKKDPDEVKKPPPPRDNHVAPNPEVNFPVARSHVAQCEQLDDAVLRLQCFDRLGRDLGFAQDDKTEQQLEKFGFWTATSKMNGMGERLINMRLPPNTPYITSTGVVRMPELILSCRVNYTEAYIDWKAELGGPAKMDVVYNFDNEPTISTRWDLSNDTFALFIPQGLDFIRSLNGKKTLTVQFQPGGEPLVVMVFSLDGLQNVLNLMYEHCYKS